MTILDLSNVRTSYLYWHEPFLAKPSPQNPNPKPVFTSHFLMAPNHPDLAKVAATIEEVGLAEWKDQWPMFKEAFKQKDSLCLHKGDVTKVGQPEYAGLYYVSGNNKRRFTVIRGDRTPIVNPTELYSGCWVNAKIDIWAQNNQWGKRINATITGIQLVRTDEAFGGGAKVAAPEEFGLIGASADSAPPAAGADPLAGLIG